MEIPFVNKRLSSNIIHLDSDKNDRFILGNCARYLYRHFTRYAFFDNETLKMLCWTLWHENKIINKFLVENLSQYQISKFKKKLSEDGDDFEDYVDLVYRTLKKSKSNQLIKLQRLVIRLLERRFKRPGYRGKAEIEKNVMTLKRMFDLTEHEMEFIIFLFIISSYEAPQEFFVNHLECNKLTGRKYLINLLGITKSELNEILSGTLKRIEFFEMDNYDLRVEDKFLDLFLNPDDENFSQQFYLKIPSGGIPLENYLIRDDEKNHVLRLLKKKPKTATHILLYGPPGTGKTSFACSLADQLDAPGYEIVRDETNATKNRRAAILACLNMTNTGSGSLIIVDEADNLLNTRFSYFMRGETQDKGWLNGLLENPGTRMIWLTNQITGIDDSVLRRFAYSLHFKSFNRRQRIQLWENILRKNRVKKYFNAADVGSFAKKYKVSAGVIDLAVMKSIETNPKSKTQFQKAVELALESHETLTAFGERPLNKHKVEKNYSLEGLQVKGDVMVMMDQLEIFNNYLNNTGKDKIMNMNLLFYGPPGSGKSELARYIADRLDREIICKRVSDLQSKWVGEGEKNIKWAFQEAEAEDAILIIDEANSLLLSRERAVRSWEISFTNEFLTQMERFRGILICTTNRLKDLDDASIRRFSHKMEFDYLLPGGNVIFYEKLLARLIETPLDRNSKAVLRNIPGLAPGDFKTVRDRFSFYPQNGLTHQMLINALIVESRIKNVHGKNKKIGF
jgi:SpoVK/Ycf46/Vps4 family AAA+-type ATPase